ncbi:TetR/AcrR family transcriptional regulator [Enterobacter kobei]|uniref:TetR/AcrR family transcriptional regulator n=1 Tax=Enterobacter kobei TaxID=208224 RepID=UPI00388D73EE
MPRPELKSDDEVLEAATVVLKRCGPIEFTLSGVAKEVGLSRAALIQRFTNRDTLLVRMMERGVEQVRHYLNARSIGAGPQGPGNFCRCARSSMNTRNDFGELSHLPVRAPKSRSYARLRSQRKPRGGGGDPQSDRPQCSCGS